MRSAANGHSYANGNGLSESGPGPCMLTICGIRLNPVPACFTGLVFDFGP